MFRVCGNMPRILRDIILLILGVCVIITILLASESDDNGNRIMGLPQYFRGQLLQKTNFKGPQNERQTAVVAAFEHAWKGYRKYAWGHDNLRPVSRQSSDWFGLGMTIVDSLTTMLVMDLKDDFAEARQWIENDLRFDVDKNVSLFEVTIRVLGGLLSAYHLTGDPMFLAKSVS